MKRVIDHDNDWYSKTIIDPQTGEIILSVEHPSANIKDTAPRNGNATKSLSLGYRDDRNVDQSMPDYAG